MAQERHIAQHRMVMSGLMRVAPAQALEGLAIAFGNPDQRIVERHAGGVGAGLDRRRLLDIAPGGGAIDIAEHPFDEDRIGVVEFARERPEVITNEAVHQGAHPCGIEEWLWQVFVHFAVPVGEHGERALAQAFGRAFGRGFAGEPEIGPDQRQEGAGGKADGVELRLDKAVAGVHLAALHEPAPAVDALGVAPEVADMHGKGAVHHLVVGIAEDATGGGHELGVGGKGQHALPAVFRQPAACGHAPFALVAGVAAGHGPDGAHGDCGLVHQGEVLRGRDVEAAEVNRVLH